MGPNACPRADPRGSNHTAQADRSRLDMRFTRILAVAAAGTLATALGGIGVAFAADGVNKSGTHLGRTRSGAARTSST